MLKKLKQKLFNIKTVSLPLFLLIGFFVLLWPFKIFAASQIFQPNNISLTVDTYINGSSTPSAYGRIGLDSSANLTVRVVVKLAQASACADDGSACPQSMPVSSVKFGSDSIFLTHSIDVFGTKTISLDGVTAGLINQGVSSNGNTYKCFSDTIGTVSATSINYSTCTFPSQFRVDTKNNPATVPVGGIVLDKTFTIRQRDLSSLGITQPSQRYTVYAAPGLFFGASGLTIGLVTNVVDGGLDMVFANSGGKAVLIDSYDTQANADIANQTQGIPSDIPGYGSTTSNAKTTSGGNPIATFLNQFIGSIVAFIQEALYDIFSIFVAPLISALLSIHPYKDSFVAVIYPGWIVVRNICNIFFILALIIIAMATLFRVESYQYKHLITQLIIAALLINFSLVIAQAILGLADTIQAQFLGNNVTSINTLAQNLLVNNNGTLFTTAVNNSNASALNNSIFAGTIQNLFWLSLTVGTFCVFLAIAVFLTIRIVALWVLLMVSPIAYACGVLPSTAQYRATWWQSFLKYAFFTPILGFFLNLTVVMVSNAKGNPILKDIVNNGNFTSANGIANFAISIGSNILILIFLIASIKVAEQSGTLSADKIAGWAQTGLFKPFSLAGKASKAIASRSFEGVQNVSHITLDPSKWADAWKKYSEEQKHKREDVRAGKTTFGLNLGSPQDMLKNYANIAAIRKLGKKYSTQGRFKELGKQQKELLEKSKLMIDPNKDKLKDNLKNEIKNLEKLKNEVAFNESDIASSESDLEKIDQDIIALSAARNDLSSQKSGLKLAGKDTTAIDNEIAANNKAQYDKAKEKGKLSEKIAKLKLENEDKKKAVSRSGNVVKRMEAQIKADDDIRNAYGISKFDNDDLGKVKSLLKEYSDLSSWHKNPEAYYAREARLHLEGDESKKISDIEDADELISSLRDATNQKDQHKATAILKKLTKDVNLNEALERAGYATSFQGFKKFMKEEFEDKIGVDPHEVMQIATEISYIAEGTKQFNFARSTEIKDGHIHWVGEHDADGGEEAHNKIVITQMRKSDPRAASGLVGRFSVVDEENVGGERIKALNEVGIAHILRYANPSTIKHMGQFNTYALEAAVSDPEWREKLRGGADKYGAEKPQVELLIKEIEKIMANKAK